MLQTKRIFQLILILFLFFSLATPMSAQEQKDTTNNSKVCATYFTGIGCPHCSQADPLVLGELPNRYSDFILIEYEIYQNRNNGALLNQYHSNYGMSYGVPSIILDENSIYTGDRNILNKLEAKIQQRSSNSCPLPQGEKVSFESLDLNSLPQTPKIWSNNRILKKCDCAPSQKQVDGDKLKKLITAPAEEIPSIVKQTDFQSIKAKPSPLSGGSIDFEHAVKLNGWILQWNGPGLEQAASGNNSNNTAGTSTSANNFTSAQAAANFSWGKIFALAAADAVNPCALAVLALILTAILTYNPKNRKNVIWAGLAFVSSVFLMYLVYGLIIIKFFQLIQSLTMVRLYLYKILGVVAIILGILNIKDFFAYSPGSMGTEMPLSMRPKLKRMVSRITSPAGAFGIGIFVTLFLLPCTIGPYVICCGALSVAGYIQALPKLIVYNLIFVLPMLVIVGIVYAGLRNVQDVSAWKEKHITKLHLTAGLIMLLLGVVMLLGWI